MPSIPPDTFREDEVRLARRRLFDKPLDTLTVTEFTKLATLLRAELGYEQPMFLYLHEYMRRYVAKRRNTESTLTGEDIYKYTKAKAPKYYKLLKGNGLLTLEDAKLYRDKGWEEIPERRKG